ncbi:MAG: hypothetical protein ACO3A2_01355 [Bdellovibrionia bacterium]
MYLLKVALRPWHSAPLSQILSGLAGGVLLFLVGFFLWVDQGLKPLVLRLKGEQVITAYVDPSMPLKSQGAFLDQVKEALKSESMKNPLDIQWLSSKQFVDRLKPYYPELARELEDLGSESQQLIPETISITGVLSDRAVEKVRKIPGIESVESSKDRYKQSASAFSALRWVLRFLVVGVALALLTGLIQLSRLNSYFQAETLEFFQMWGGAQQKVLLPVVLSSFFVGLLMGALACFSWLTLGSWLTAELRSLSPWLKSVPSSAGMRPVLLFIWGCVLGVLAGAVSFFTAPRGGRRLEQGGGR